MTKDELAALQPGDLIRHKHCGEMLVVTGSYGGRVTAVRTSDVTNSVEWELVKTRSDRRTLPL